MGCAALKRFWVCFFYMLSEAAYEKAAMITSLFDRAMETQIEMGCERRRCRCVPNGIHYERFHEIPLKKENGYIDIGTVLRIAPIKDVKTMLYAFAELKARVKNARLTIVGPKDDEEYARECYALAEQLHIGDLYFAWTVNILEHMEKFDFTCYEENGITPYRCEAFLQEGGETGPSEDGFGYGERVANATVCLRESGACGQPQKSYRIDIKEGKGKWDGQKMVLLNKHAADPVRFKNRLAYSLMQEIPSNLPYWIQTQWCWRSNLRSFCRGSLKSCFRQTEGNSPLFPSIRSAMSGHIFLRIRWQASGRQTGGGSDESAGLF